MKRPYRMSEVQRQHARQQIEKALDEGWIQPSQSAWGTAILMVPKKDGAWRLCVDYQELNALTIQDAYPLPRIDDLLHKLGKAKYFTKLDLEAGYHQIWMEPDDRDKTAFRIAEPVRGHCLFEWRVMPFGLRNAPPTFQRYMTLVMTPCEGHCIVYMDDLLVYSATREQHVKDVANVFVTLRQAQLKVKRAKCVFGATAVEFLGHVVTEGRIAMEPSKKTAIVQWKSPLTTPKQVKQFMGIVSYYRNFIPRLSTIAEPLTRLTQKRTRMEWGWEAECAMERLKQAVIEADDLVVWDPTLPTRVSTDASDVGMGAIIEQRRCDEVWCIVSSWSKKLSPCQTRYSVTDREWLAVVESVSRVWRHWLLGKAFQVRTDHAALREILTKKGEEFTPRQLRWYEKLEPYTFTVTYVKGNENVVPDALSRTPAFYVNAVEVNACSPHDLCGDELCTAAQADAKYVALLRDTTLHKTLGVTPRGNLLCTQLHQVCVPASKALRYKLVLEAHEPAFAGHFGFDKTLAHTQRLWWWPKMRETVETVIKGCPTCQSDATKRMKDQGPLRPIQASRPWEIVTIDFVSGFTPSQRTRHSACCVVCDRFTRMIHIETCRDHATAREAVGMILRMVISRHGCPRVILSDRGTQFDSELWREVWKMLGTRVALATTHHPQTNGLTERMNRTLISLIRRYAGAYPKRWAELLPCFEFAYNAAVNASTKVAPFMANQGYMPLVPAQLLSIVPPTESNEGDATQVQVYELQRALHRIHKMVRENETRNEQTVKQREDQKRGNHQYRVGDEVLVYWPPFRAYSDESRKHRLRYVGPFVVARVLGMNACELEGLPSRMPKEINVEYLHPYRRDADGELAALRTAQPPPQPHDSHPTGGNVANPTTFASSPGGAVLV